MINTFTVVVSSVVFNSKGQVLLGKRSKYEDVFPGLWGIPGGKLEVETDLLDPVETTLIREAREEMGIKIEPQKYISSSCRVTGEKAKLYLIYSSIHKSGIPKPLEDTDEVGWFDIEQLKLLKLTPSTYENILLATKF